MALSSLVSVITCVVVPTVAFSASLLWSSTKSVRLLPTLSVAAALVVPLPTAVTWMWAVIPPVRMLVELTSVQAAKKSVAASSLEKRMVCPLSMFGPPVAQQVAGPPIFYSRCGRYVADFERDAPHSLRGNSDMHVRVREV